jgi:hypothetical protein
MDNSLNLVIHIDFELNNIVDRLDYPVAVVAVVVVVVVLERLKFADLVVGEHLFED